MSDKVSVLAVDDDLDVLFSLKLFLKNNGIDAVTESNPQNVSLLIQEKQFDVVLLDMNYSRDTCSGDEGFDLLKEIHGIDPFVQVIFMTAYGDIEKAVKALKEGALDFILKPWQNEKLLATIISAYELANSKREREKLIQKQHVLLNEMNAPFHNIIGQSSQMIEVFEMIKKVAPTEANILITGENGTGKELVARAIHNCSLKKNNIFLMVDLGSIPETLFEAELFGYLKGAFTDAKKEKIGRFELAEEGTLFLDEIGNLNLHQQAKLLTVLEKKEIIPIGSNRSKPINVRLICATNEPLSRLKSGEYFRKDLLFRINTVEINLPSLRERKEDIPLLVSHYFTVFRKKYNKQTLDIDTSAMRFLSEYSWPGNIRELQHAIERSVILATKTIQKEDFSYLNQSTHVETNKSYQLSDLEKNAIMQVIKKHQGNITFAAKELGLTRSALYRRLEKYGI